jgi:neutral ceramidase
MHPANPNELDPALRTRFVATAAGAIAAAHRDLQPVDLLFGHAEVEGVAANRNDPALPADSRLSVLATRRGDGSLHCVVVHFACHPTILGANSRGVSADFPGALRRQLTEILRQGDAAPIVLFVNGAAGDISTRFTRRAQDAAEVERLGGLLAAAASVALRAARTLNGPMRHRAASVALTPRAHPSPERNEEDNSVSIVEDRATSAPSAGQQRIAETRQQGATMLAALAALPEGAIADRCDLDVWTLGDLALVSVPAELFSSFGSQIASASDEPTLVLGYANGYIGYLADRRAHDAGTYEALASPYRPEAGEQVTAATVNLVSRLRSNRKPAIASA